jgi:hypothetical protein
MCTVSLSPPLSLSLWLSLSLSGSLWLSGSPSNSDCENNRKCLRWLEARVSTTAPAKLALRAQGKLHLTHAEVLL